ncbi:hypothetical protein SISNIDRAFT_472419 [Sistotremastrum niveocremeum HHB9708]|uniref:Uncharacterized protein n=1 Tax=Sistotremastrum niveocremeum HHB9708 TaxID=1314777 RepID=A0A165A6C0_9AGAM|nr:hypothetical protein SISNIDRAFT_472419 [Sistotremastrum niveocremeum HHB9708]
MQPPTLVNTRIRSVEDALKVFHAVNLEILPMIHRRLGPAERQEVRPGNVYVWEERSPNSEQVGLGIERWTDGRQYQPSRVKDEFLLYLAKPDASSSSTSDHSRQPDNTGDENRLIKQTYSVYVTDSEPRRKWHLTAYYTPAMLQYLHTIDAHPLVGMLQVPEGAIRSHSRR